MCSSLDLNAVETLSAMLLAVGVVAIEECVLSSFFCRFQDFGDSGESNFSAGSGENWVEV